MRFERRQAARPGPQADHDALGQGGTGTEGGQLEVTRCRARVVEGERVIRRSQRAQHVRVRVAGETGREEVQPSCLQRLGYAAPRDPVADHRADDRQRERQAVTSGHHGVRFGGEPPTSPALQEKACRSVIELVDSNVDRAHGGGDCLIKRGQQGPAAGAERTHERHNGIRVAHVVQDEEDLTAGKPLGERESQLGRGIRRPRADRHPLHHRASASQWLERRPARQPHDAVGKGPTGADRARERSGDRALADAGGAVQRRTTRCPACLLGPLPVHSKSQRHLLGEFPPGEGMRHQEWNPVADAEWRHRLGQQPDEAGDDGVHGQRGLGGHRLVAAKPLGQVLEAAGTQDRNHRDAEVVGEAPLLAYILAAQRAGPNDEHQPRTRLDRAPDLLVERGAAAGERVTVKPDPHARPPKASHQRVEKPGVVSPGIGQERVKARANHCRRSYVHPGIVSCSKEEIFRLNDGVGLADAAATDRRPRSYTRHR